MFDFIDYIFSDCILEHIVREIRVRKVANEIKDNPILLDIGCGFNYRFLNFIKDKVSKGYGVDQKVRTSRFENIKLINFYFENKLPFENETFNTITLLATFEHIADHKKLITEMRRILKNNGKIIMTIPSQKSKKLLELLGKLRLLNQKEVLDHKSYFSNERIVKFFESYGFKNMKIESFELGMNHLFIFVKDST